MPSVFTRIINGDEPGRLVWSDDQCVAFIDSAPLTPGHVLVVPRAQIDHWIDVPDDVLAHLWRVVGIVGKAQYQAFECKRIGVLVMGYEVPHVHVHTFPTTSMGDFAMSGKDFAPDPAGLDRAAEAIRAQLLAAGFDEQTVRS